MQLNPLARLVLLGAVLVLVGGYFWFYHVASNAPDSTSPVQAGTLAQAQLDALQAIRQAETISDPLERCLAYPNPTGYRWAKEEVAAFCADEFTPTITWSEFKDAIEDGKAAKVDGRFDALLDGYFAGTIPEGAWMAAYSNNFSGTNALNLELVDQWIKQSPGSAHAIFARGMQEYAMAAAARGEKTIDETDPDSLDRMREANRRSREFLDKALAINPRITPAYRVLIWIAKYEGDEVLAGRAMEEANHIDPANFYVRAALMETYDPRWGGSFAQMDQLASDAQKFSSRNPRMPNLLAIATASRGYDYHFEKDYGRALTEFDKGLRYGPVGIFMDLASYAASEIDDDFRAVALSSQMLRFSPDREIALYRRAVHLLKLDQDAWAQSDLEHILRRNPGDPWAMFYYAKLLIKQDKYEAAEAKLRQLVVSDPENRAARELLIWIYGYRLGRVEDADALIGEMIEKNPEDGGLWLLRVRLLDSKPGTRMREAVESFLKYADQSSEDQRKAIPIARKWLQNHPRSR